MRIMVEFGQAYFVSYWIRFEILGNRNELAQIMLVGTTYINKSGKCPLFIICNSFILYHQLQLRLALRVSATFWMNSSVLQYLSRGTSLLLNTHNAKSLVMKPFSTV